MASTVQIRSLPDLTGARRGALLAYHRLLLNFLLAGGAQIFLAGFGVFSVTGHGASADSAFSAHRGLGLTMADAVVTHPHPHPHRPVWWPARPGRAAQPGDRRLPVRIGPPPAITNG